MRETSNLGADAGQDEVMSSLSKWFLKVKDRDLGTGIF